MKIFSIKRLLGLAAVYGAVQYARKHGGAKNAFNELITKAKDFAGEVKGDVSSVVSDVSRGSGIGSSYSSEDRYSSESSGYSGTGNGIGGSTGMGGNGRRGGY